MKISKINKGMYIEELIEKTIDYFSSKNIAHFEKRYLPIKIIKIKKNNLIEGILLKKSFTDFNGIYSGKYIDFETKQTDNNFFDINNLKEHQIKHLLKISEYGGISFLIIHFFRNDKTFFVDINQIYDLFKNKQRKIKIEYFIKNCEEILIEFPGIINFLKIINKKHLLITK